MRTLLIGFVLLAQSVYLVAMQSALPREQSDFSTEDKIITPIPLPSAIRQQLEKDSFVRETMTAELSPNASLPGAWTLRSVIHLKSKNEIDYVVVGQRSLTGAHATHFWVFRETSNGMKLVLKAFSDSLSIEKQRTNGLRDIATLYYTTVSDGTIRYTFNGI